MAQLKREKQQLRKANKDTSEALDKAQREKQQLIRARKQAFEALAKATKTKLCFKHQHPLNIFCNEPDCQDIICDECMLEKHDTHKTMGLFVKARELKEEMRKYWDAMDCEQEKFTKQIEKMQEMKSDISDTLSIALERIDEVKERLITDLENEAQVHKMEMLTFAEKEISRLNDTCIDLNERKHEIAKYVTEITKLMASSSGLHEIMSNNAQTKQLYRDIFTKIEANPMWPFSYSTMDFEASNVRLPYPTLGNMTKTTNTINHPGLGHGSWQDVDHAILHAEAGFQVASPVTAKIEKHWEVVGHLLTGSPTGKIYVGECGGTTIQAFDFFGNLLMKKFIPTGFIKGLACLHNNGRDMLVISAGEQIVLLDGISGELLDTLSIPSFTPNGPMCQDSASSVLVCGKMGMHWVLVQCVVEDETIKQTAKNITLPLPQVRSLTCIVRNTSRVIMAASDSDNSIVAIDWESGGNLGTISTENTDEESSPWGICTDEKKYLFVGCKNGDRVLISDLEQQGQIQGEINTSIYGEQADICCFPCYNKIIVAVKNWVYVFDLQYHQ